MTDNSSTGSAGPIVRAAIHPAIGVGRVGSSDEWYIGPQVVHPKPEPPRDGQGALKRQAAEFRIYGYDAAGKVVRELTAADADITWTVHVANRKAQWYEWQMALDIPEAAGYNKNPIPLRNADVKGADREGLAIDGGPVSLTGAGIQGDDYVCAGTFQGTPVTLGEALTDEAGRLVFVAARGISASPKGTPIWNGKDTGFINADGWYDDTCDGPVTATVRLDGVELPVDPAWVLTAPPNYGPTLLGVRTLYDLLFDLYVQCGRVSAPGPVVSFRYDVYPILRRLTGLGWVNKAYAVQFGPQGPYAFEDPAFVARLAQKPAEGQPDVYAELRRQVLNAFRNPSATDNNQLPWPWLYGDAMAVQPLARTPRQNAWISPTQYAVLQAWAAGSFHADWNEPGSDPHELSGVSVPDQPATLDRAALEHCLADAFHPGCEVTWPMRHLTLFMVQGTAVSPMFRILHRPPGTAEPNYGSGLTPTIALSPEGPLHAQGPGDLTRWMGLPWQADTAWCRGGYDPSYDPYAPTFWPARVPNEVLTEDAYEAVMAATTPEARLAAYLDRASWTRALPNSTAGAMTKMVEIFGDMGVLEVRPGIEDDPALPRVMLVESVGPDFPHVAPAEALQAVAGVAHPKAKLRARGIVEGDWRTEETPGVAPLPVRHPPPA